MSRLNQQSIVERRFESLLRNVSAFFAPQRQEGVVSQFSNGEVALLERFRGLAVEEGLVDVEKTQYARGEGDPVLVGQRLAELQREHRSHGS